MKITQAPFLAIHGEELVLRSIGFHPRKGGSKGILVGNGETHACTQTATRPSKIPLFNGNEGRERRIGFMLQEPIVGNGV